MQISANTTGMQAGLCVATDPDARDHCVAVVKGTFTADASGELMLAGAQEPLCPADEHYGDPATTAIRRPCDFALSKPYVDVLLDGVAHAPSGEATRELLVEVEIAGRRKPILVSGEREWISVAGQLMPSEPAPFVEMPLTFDRAFGGMDDSQGPQAIAAERRNLVGVGFHPKRSAAEIEGTRVPNLERPDQRVTSPRSSVAPVGYGAVGRAWTPRVDYAGTYDARWREERCPFLPQDFDPRYYQCAPEDQWLPAVEGGELIRCHNMAPSAVVSYVLPRVQVPVRFRFADREVEERATLDTVLLEPHLARAQLTWRCSVPLGKKLNQLREVFVGELPTSSVLLGYRDGKPRFRSLGDALRWLREQRKARA